MDVVGVTAAYLTVVRVGTAQCREAYAAIAPTRSISTDTIELLP